MNEDLIFRLAKPEEAEVIHKTMQTVYTQVENKETFVCDELEWVKEQLEIRGFAVLACDGEEKIAGSLIVSFPGMDEDNLGRDTGLPEEKLDKVVHMESAVVLPEYRGKHLQRKLLQYAEDILDKKRFRYLMCTISPENPASYKSIEALGYELMLTKEKYGGKIRRIYCKQIS